MKPFKPNTRFTFENFLYNQKNASLIRSAQTLIQTSLQEMFDIATACLDFQKIQALLYSLLFCNEFSASPVERRKIKEIAHWTDCRKIISVVAEHFQINPIDLLSAKRERSIVWARHIALYLCREVLGLTYSQIGDEFGGKNHSSVLYSIKKIKSLQRENTELNKMLKKLAQACLQN